LLFAAVMACLLPFAEMALPAEWLLSVKGIAEVTSGCFAVVQSGLSARITVSLVAGFLGFGGLCVMMQAKGMLQGTDIRFKTYVYGKVLHGAFSALMTFFVYPHIFLDSVSVFAVMGGDQIWLSVLNSSSILGSILVVFSCIFLCIKLKK